MVRTLSQKTWEADLGINSITRALSSGYTDAERGFPVCIGRTHTHVLVVILTLIVEQNEGHENRIFLMASVDGSEQVPSKRKKAVEPLPVDCPQW